MSLVNEKTALEAAEKLEERLEELRDEEEGWDDLALYAGLVRSFIKEVIERDPSVHGESEIDGTAEEEVG
ncbi:MAG: hypothetical protein ACRDPE_15790 [Solirubrobacterales bacterium]